jgi:hypothetical protein
VKEELSALDPVVTELILSLPMATGTDHMSKVIFVFCALIVTKILNG